MGKSIKRIAAVMLIVLALAQTAYAGGTPSGDAQPFRYVALGDSISAYYRVDKGHGYAELLAGFLANEPGCEGLRLTNLSRSGDDSSDILKMIEAYPDTIRGADLITICIGANNFLGLVLNRVYGFLADKFGEGASLDDLEVSGELIGEMAASLGGMSFLAEISNSIERLTADIGLLIPALKELAPESEILFMTIYNPLGGDDPTLAIADVVIQNMNAIIEDYSKLGYSVVDVYGAFRERGEEGLTFMDLENGSFDPHPTETGHRLIANAHFRALTGRDIEYPEQFENYLPLTRAEAIAGLFEAVFATNTTFMRDVYSASDYAGEPGGNGDAAFSDVPPTHPQYRYIRQAALLGIVNGVGGGLFLPDTNMTRQDYAVLLSRLFDALDERGYTLDRPSADGTPLPGAGDASPYAADAINMFASTALLRLRDGSVDPLAQVTSAEIREFRSIT